MALPEKAGNDLGQVEAVPRNLDQFQMETHALSDERGGDLDQVEQKQLDNFQKEHCLQIDVWGEVFKALENFDQQPVNSKHNTCDKGNCRVKEWAYERNILKQRMTEDTKDTQQSLSKNWDKLRNMITYRGLKSLVYQQCARNAKEKDWIHSTQLVSSCHNIWNMLSAIPVKMRSFSKMYSYLVLMLFHTVVVSPMEITASYTTSFRCRNGSYALISGANLTLEYDYGHSYTQLHSFHLSELIKLRQMFDYESAAGKAFIKDNRLQTYEWTATGIKLTITGITKERDLGKYEGFVDIGEDYKQKSIEVQEIFDSPTELKITTNSTFEDRLILTEGFNEYTFDASVESYADIACSDIMVTWVSLSKGNLRSCQVKDGSGPILCPLTLKEKELTTDECMTLDVFAEQYGVRSENKTYTVCYNNTKEHSDSDDVPYMHVIIGMVVCVFVLAINITVIVVFVKRRGQSQENGKGSYTQANKDAEGGSGPQCAQI